MKNLFKTWLLFLPFLGVVGCSSIHSKAVKSLIAVEGTKLEAANQSAAKLMSSTKGRTDAMKSALSSLDDALKKQNTSELVHALIFSSNQNIDSKRGSDAHAVTYLIGKLYLEEQAGLQKQVNDQFLADISGLEQQAVRIQQSWASLKDLHAKVEAFANKSGFASIDPDFVAALATEIPGASAEIETVLNDSQKVNQALEAALNLPQLKGTRVEQARSSLGDLIDLLERVKATPKSGSP